MIRCCHLTSFFSLLDLVQKNLQDQKDLVFELLPKKTNFKSFKHSMLLSFDRFLSLYLRFNFEKLTRSKGFGLRALAPVTGLTIETSSSLILQHPFLVEVFSRLDQTFFKFQFYFLSAKKFHRLVKLFTFTVFQLALCRGRQKWPWWAAYFLGRKLAQLVAE